MPAPMRCMTPPAARQRPRPNARICGKEVSYCPPRSCAGRMEDRVNRATRIQVQIFSECLPADSMSAAAISGTSARPQSAALLSNYLRFAHARKGAMSVHVQVFGRRDDETEHALKRPASKKRQGTKSRAVGQWLAASAM